MKTLTEKYQALQQGSFSAKQFTRDARLAHPNLVTQFTSFEDAVKILKNKGLVHEAKKEEVELNLPPTSLDKAIKYELEKAGVDYLMAAPDTDEYLKAKAKAEKALVKDRLYYLELDTSKKKRTDLMEPVTTKNVVDKGNEMKKVNLNEMKKVIKTLIVKSLNEESQPFRLMATRLLDTLSTAIDAAERVGTAAEMDRDSVADDPEAMTYTKKVEDALKRIYNGYMTGNREDDRSGEIFKSRHLQEDVSDRAYEMMEGISNTQAQEAVKKGSAIILRELTEEGFEEEDVLEFLQMLIKTNYGIVTESSINESNYDLMFGKMGNGITVSNKKVTDPNTKDYKFVAHISDSGKIDWKDKEAQKNPTVRREVEKRAKSMNESVNAFLAITDEQKRAVSTHVKDVLEYAIDTLPQEISSEEYAWAAFIQRFTDSWYDKMADGFADHAGSAPDEY